MTHESPTTEVDIWCRVIAPETGDLPNEVAREWLRLRISDTDSERVEELSRQANSGQLTASQERELDMYLTIGQALEFLHAKARLSLRNRRADK